MAAITMTAAPMHPIRFGKLTSGNTPGAQLPSTAFCIVLSNLGAVVHHGEKNAINPKLGINLLANPGYGSQKQVQTFG